MTNAGGAGHGGGGTGGTGGRPTFRLEPLMTGSAMPGWHWASGMIGSDSAAGSGVGPITGRPMTGAHCAVGAIGGAGAGRNAAGTSVWPAG
jgi:hypothetical protein